MFPGVQCPKTLNSPGPGSIHLLSGRNELLGVFTEPCESNTLDNPGHVPSIFVPDKKGTVMDQGGRPEPVQSPWGRQVHSEVPKNWQSSKNALGRKCTRNCPGDKLPQPNMGDLVNSVRNSSAIYFRPEAIIANSEPMVHVMANSLNELEPNGKHHMEYSFKQQFPSCSTFESPQIDGASKQELGKNHHSENVDSQCEKILYSRPSMSPTRDLPPLEPTSDSEEEDSTWEVYYEKMKDPQGEFHFVKRYRYKEEVTCEQKKPGMQKKMHQDNSEGDDESTCQDDHKKAQDDRVTFFGRLKMVWSIMGDELPTKSDDMKKKRGSHSLLSSKSQEREENPWLPIGDLVRSSLQYWTDEGKNLKMDKDFSLASRPKSNMEGKFPMNRRPVKWYRTISEDFPLEPPNLSENIRRSLKDNKTPQNISFTESVQRNMERINRIGLSAASTKDWMLASIKKLMDQMLSDLTGEQPEVNNIIEGIRTCSELLDSVGKASETEVQALSYNLYVLTLSRRDSILKYLHISDTLKEEMRHAPLLWEEHGLKPADYDNPNLLFRGMDSKLEADKKRQADQEIQDFILSKRFKYDSQHESKSRKPDYHMNKQKPKEPKFFAEKLSPQKRKQDSFRPQGKNMYSNVSQRGKAQQERGSFRGTRGGFRGSRGFRGAKTPSNKYYK